MIELVLLATMISEAPMRAVKATGIVAPQHAECRLTTLPHSSGILPSRDARLTDLAHLDFAIQTPAPESKPEFGTKDSWRWQVQAGGGLQVDDSASRFGLVGAGASYFLFRDVSVDVELNGMFIDQEGADAVGANLNLLMRWHFHHDRQRHWSLYVDGGVGMLEANKDVPSDKGSHFNFTPQLGVGGTWEVADNVRMMAGVRWHHISNANLYDVNDGRDSVFAYVGLSLPF